MPVDLMALAEGAMDSPTTRQLNDLRGKSLDRSKFAMFDQPADVTPPPKPRTPGKVWTPPAKKLEDHPSPVSVATAPDFGALKEDDTPVSPKLTENPFLQKDAVKRKSASPPWAKTAMPVVTMTLPAPTIPVADEGSAAAKLQARVRGNQARDMLKQTVEDTVAPSSPESPRESVPSTAPPDNKPPAEPVQHSTDWLLNVSSGAEQKTDEEHAEDASPSGFNVSDVSDQVPGGDASAQVDGPTPSPAAKPSVKSPPRKSFSLTKMLSGNRKSK